MVTKTSMHLPVHHETSVAKLAVVQQTRPNDQTGLSQNERGNIADQNTRSWKPKTCTATRGRYLWLQKILSGKMAVRGTFLGSAPDTWVHFLYFSHSGRITQSSPSSLITSCLKTSRRCVMSLNRVTGNELMMYFVRTTPACLQTHFTLRTRSYNTNLKQSVRLQIKSHVFPLKPTQPRMFWTLSGASRICSLWESREIQKAAESRPSSVCLVAFPFFQDREMVGVMAIADSLLSL